MTHLSKIIPTVAVAAIGVLVTGPGAVATSPSLPDLNPPPPDFYTCRTVVGGTLCTAQIHEVKDSEPQPELVCGTGADAFVIHDNGVLDQRWTRHYNADAQLIKRVVHEDWSDTFWSNPLSGKTVPYTQYDTITDVLTVPGDFGSAVETTVGKGVYTDPVTHQKVLRSVGRTVFGADGNLEFQAGQQPFITAFVDGDMSVFDGVCDALS